MPILARVSRTQYSSAVLVLALIFLFAACLPVRAQSAMAVITYPPNLATDADLSLPIQWTSVDNVQAYYLYIGSTPGGHDLVNTGEILKTSYLAANVPTNQTLYARMWTKAGGVWQFVDSTFVAVPPIKARITYPADGAVAADMSQRITWTSVANVQVYYLYVGTTRGGKDLVNTGETLQTSYLALNLPPNQTLYARINTRVGGAWRYVDSTFSVAAPVKAVITYPADGAVNADMSRRIQWSTVAGAQAYYLYVGTTRGARDLADTGETQQTSVLAANLPANQTLYARMWTKLGGAWRYVDSTFSAAPLLKSLITYPADGAVDADMSQRIQWTAVANVDTYYLYVGTTVGAKDLVNTGETLRTSYLATSLPPNQTLYVRLFTKVGGVWRWVDSTFTAAPAVKAYITYPADGALKADLSQPIQWTSVASVQSYYLYVGSTLGAKDLVDTGEIQQTSYLAANLPAKQTLYARLWTRKDGVWRYVDTTFTVAPPPPIPATLTYPADGAVNVDQSRPFTWTAVNDVQAYYLYVGTSPGAKDLVNSGETKNTSVVTTRFGVELPTGVTVYARLFTRANDVWVYRDSTFTAARLSPRFVYPTDGAIGVNLATPFSWLPAGFATAHELRIGTTPGGTDVFKSGTIATPAAMVTIPSRTGTLYARALSKVNATTWTFTDIAFTLEPSVAPSSIVVPANGDAGFDTVRAFEWVANPLARGYRLSIGTAPGATDLHDSGEIQVTRRFVPNLPIGTPLFGRVQTKIAGQWFSSDFTFTVSANSVSSAVQIQSAFWATHFVRSMAASDNRPLSWTELTARRYFVTCYDYAMILLQVWTEMNGQLTLRPLAITMSGWDTHELTELFVPETQTWMVLDPTFDLTVKRASDGGWATAEDVSAATRSQRWSDITYVLLGPEGDSFARGYYVDYPLLYVNVYHVGQTINHQGGPVLPYMQEVPMPLSAPYAYYSIGCTGVTSTSLRVNGVDQVLDCNGRDNLSRIFGAKAVAPNDQTANGVKLYRPLRYVF